MVRRCLRPIVHDCLLAASLLLLALPCSAQTSDQFFESFEHLPSLVRPGDTVTVLTDAPDVPTTGTVVELSPTTLQLNVGKSRRTFDESEVTKILKTSRGDSVKNGAATGALVGAFAVGFTVAMSVPELREQLLKDNSNADGQEAMGIGLMLMVIGAPGAIVGAGVGAIVDAFKRDTRRHVVYERRRTVDVAVTPLAGRNRTGALVSIGF